MPEQRPYTDEICYECGSDDTYLLSWGLHRCNECGCYFDTIDNEPEPVKTRKQTFDDERG